MTRTRWCILDVKKDELKSLCHEWAIDLDNDININEFLKDVRLWINRVVCENAIDLSRVFMTLLWKHYKK